MSNDDCSALCPKCGNKTLLGLMKNGYKNPCHTISVYCSKCEWEESWKRTENGAFIKQPEPPKTTTKIFKIEYTNSDPSFPHDVDRLDGKNNT